MSLIKTITSGIGKLAIMATLLGAFAVGLVSVVWLSLRGEEIKVPEIIGKNKNEAENELKALGLKMKRRADRYSQETPDTILEQLPKSGETVKTGQVISVVVARLNPEGTEEPAVAETPNEDDNSSNVSIPGLTKPDKNKNKNKNANVNTNKKGNQNTNVNSNKTINKNSNSSNTKTGNSNNTTNKANSSGTTPTNKNGSTTNTSVKPTPSSSVKPTSGDTRDRKVP